MNAVIISVGDELMTGAIVDTNSAYLSQRLLERGIRPVRHVTVGDDQDAIAQAITAAAAEAEVVIITGGLGPTLDDLTRQALAQAMDVELWEDRHSLKRISLWFDKAGRTMSPSNRLQALVPATAEPLDNDCGTAPGIAAKVGQADVYVMPGVPHEMVQMFDKQVASQLTCAGCTVLETLHCFGMGESAIGEKLADLMARGHEPAVGTTASSGIISVRIIARDQVLDKARQAADAAADVRKRLGNIIFGTGQQTLASVVGQLLEARGATLAVAESCTGGMLGEMITSVPGSSRYFLGGVISYANDIKVSHLGVNPADLAEHGAVSEPVVRQMAQGVRKATGATWGIAITGVAGPDGGSAEKPVGLVFIAIASDSATEVHESTFPSNRDFVRRRAALAALNHLRLKLLGK